MVSAESSRLWKGTASSNPVGFKDGTLHLGCPRGYLRCGLLVVELVFGHKQEASAKSGLALTAHKAGCPPSGLRDRPYIL